MLVPETLLLVVPVLLTEKLWLLFLFNCWYYYIFIYYIYIFIVLIPPPSPLFYSSRNWRCSVCGCNHKNFPGKIFKNLPEVGFGNTYIHEHTYTQTSQVTYNFEELEFYEKVLEESASAINARMREEDEGEGEGGGRAYAWPNKEALDYPPSPGLLGIVRSILMDTRILMTVFLVLFLYLNFSR